MGALALLAAPTAAQIVNLGSGSYTTQLVNNTGCTEVDVWFPPSDAVIEAGGLPNPVSPKITSNLAGRKIPTNDWWTSLVWPVASNPDANFSYPMYAYPGVMRAIATGLEIDQQTPSRAVNVPVAPQIPYNVDMRVGVLGMTAPQAKVHDFSDWTVTADWNDGELRATFGHGSPFVWFRTAGPETAVIDYAGVNFTILQNSGNMAVIKLDDVHYYAAIAPAGATWTTVGNSLRSTLDNKTYFTVAMLPATNDAQALARAPFYRDRAFAFPTNTTVAWSYNEATALLTTTYTATTTLLESAPGYVNNTVLGLFPHQSFNLAPGTVLAGHSIASVRGPVQALDGNSFQTHLRFSGVLPALPDEGRFGANGYSASTMATYANEWDGFGLPTKDDTYNGGKNLGKAARAAFIADELGDTAARDHLVAECKRFLQDWYSITPAEIALWQDCGNILGPPAFYYNNQWGSFVGFRAAFNTHTYLNDHHFHWGYFVYASSMVATYDPAWAAQWGPMVEMLIRDAASGDANDPLFPRLRNFDPYMGHSWAGGPAANYNGNDHESSSEAMNFHAATILWGTATDNQQMRDLGIYLYATELSGIENYWYDVNNQSFGPLGFDREVVGRLWGGGVDYYTHFGTEPWKVVGIQAVPTSAAHLYLGRYPTKLAAVMDEMTALVGNDWGALKNYLWQMGALDDPANSIALFNAQNAGGGYDYGTTTAELYYFLHSIDGLGHVDRTVWADIPTYAVFDKAGTRIHVAHNPGTTTRRVTFSDGVWLDVPAGQTITSRSPMVVTMTQPAAPTGLPAGQSLTLAATATHLGGGTVANVTWRANGTIIATDTSAPYDGSWLPAAEGTYLVQATATDTLGKTSTSDAVTITVGCGAPQTPFGGTPAAVPASGTATIQAENFDVGGEGVAYSDSTPANIGGAYRTSEGVDILTVSDAGGGHKVGYSASGEYLEFTINVAQAGNYATAVRFASGAAGGNLRFVTNCGTNSPTITLPGTGGWESWQTAAGPVLSLAAGVQIIRVEYVTGGYDLNWFSLTNTGGATPTPTPSATPTATATATPSPTATPTPSPTATPVGTPTPTPTATPVPTPTPTATPTPTPTPTPSPTGTPPGGCQATGTSANGNIAWCVTPLYNGTVTVELDSTVGSAWADIHYTINNGGQQNIRMTALGAGQHEWTISGLANGNTLRFFFTYAMNPGALDSEWFEIVIGAPPTPTPTATPTPTPSPTPSGTCQAQGSSANGQIDWCVAPLLGNAALVTLDGPANPAWADIHYTINGGGQQNIRMTAQGGGVHDWNVAGLANGDTLRFFFTYQSGIGATDSEWFEVVIGSIVPTPTPTPTATPAALNGDANNDGVVSVADVTTIYNLLAGFVAAPLPGDGDVDNNGVVEAADALALTSHLVNGAPIP